jgi:hypothetical protein
MSLFTDLSNSADSEVVLPGINFLDVYTAIRLIEFLYAFPFAARLTLVDPVSGGFAYPFPLDGNRRSICLFGNTADFE